MLYFWNNIKNARDWRWPRTFHYSPTLLHNEETIDDEETYSLFEAILKIALKNNSIPIRKEDDDYDSFFVFKEKNGTYRLKEQFVTKNHSKELLCYLGKCYTYYHDNRHTLFHWDDPTNERDTTRILNTVEEAIPIIRDSITLIDEYFTIS